MAKSLTYFGIASVAGSLFLAACGGGESGTGGTGSGGTGTGSTGSGGGFGVTGGGGPLGEGILPVSPPNGFKYEDGTGDKAYRDSAVTDDQIATLKAAIANPPAVDATLSIDYPYTGTMVAPNLNVIDFQWHSVSATETAYLVRVTGGTQNYNLYITGQCAGNGYCERTLPTEEWRTLGYAEKGKTLTFELFSLNGTTVRRGASISLTYSPESIVGALYYWAATNRTIKRATFGSDSAIDFIVPNTGTADNGCVACHSVSRDGTTIAFAIGSGEEGGENSTGIRVAPTNDPTAPYSVPTWGPAGYENSPAEPNNQATANQGHNVALSPDGARMAVNATDAPSNWPSHLDMRDTKTGTTIASYEVGNAIFGTDKIGIHPEFSPDGTKLAVSLAENNGQLSAWSNQKGGIATLPVNPDGTLGAATVIVTSPSDGSYHFYPTWSPDGKYIAFVTSWDENGTSGSLGNDHGVLRMVAVADAPVTCPGAKCIELVNGTGYSVAQAEAMDETTGSTWPKFAPFAQGGGNIYFITFTSHRKYGNLPSTKSQLWMFGIDTTKVGDPSYVPFWVPYQSFEDGSLSPYWTETIPCNTEGNKCNGCASGEVCLVDALDSSCTCGVRAIK